MMFQTRLWAAAFIIAVVVVGGFFLSVPRAGEVRDLEPVAAVTAAAVPVVSVSDAYKKGVHTLSGSVTAPDACTSVSAEASVADASSTSPRILLELTMPEDTGMCLEVPTEVSFSTAVEAPSDAALEVRVNGAAASTTAS